MGIFTKKREVAEEAKKGVNDMRLEITVKLISQESYTARTVADINVQKSLLSTSDTKIKDIILELGGVVEEIFEDADAQMKNSRYLSDGWHKEQNEPQF